MDATITHWINSVAGISVGIHCVTDVPGGALTGIAATMLVRALYREGSRLDRLATSIL